MIFGNEVQRRVRLRNAVKFDLSEILGEKIIVHVGELPQAQQKRLVSYISIRQELLDFAKKQKRTDETPEQAIERLGKDAFTEEAIAAAQSMSDSLTSKLYGVMQELVGASLLDVNGDRLSPADQAAFFDLLPQSAEAVTLLGKMSEAVLMSTGGKKTKAPAPAPAPGTPEAAAATEAEAKK